MIRFATSVVIFRRGFSPDPRRVSRSKYYYREVVPVVSAAKITHFLEGMSFPANKQQIIDYAGDNNAPQDVLDMLHNMPEGTYYSLAGIWEAVGKAA
ncbi:DUF2795 domain-containing protein [Candidatus Aquicultor secundus]|nr:DUF2795 domain-containing protein [Candidatus Aquicultor secundus]NCO65429.1 DUF2795 domain-containing protein [Solirubrobacter sp.]